MIFKNVFIKFYLTFLDFFFGFYMLNSDLIISPSPCPWNLPPNKQNLEEKPKTKSNKKCPPAKKEESYHGSCNVAHLVT